VTQPASFADQTLFADDQHWSARAHEALGSYLFCLAVTTWPQLRPPPPRRGLPPPQTRLPFACADFSEFTTPKVFLPVAELAPVPAIEAK
jgi:hypothetical protein